MIDNSPAAVKHREALHQLLVSSLNQSDTKVSPAVLRMVRSNLLCASGEDIVDDLIAFGYLQVNTNHLDKAIQVFAELLKYRSDLPAAHLGTGSAYAMMGQYEKAIAAFSQAIAVIPPRRLSATLTHPFHLSTTHTHSLAQPQQCDSTLADAWKRRGQTRAAMNQLADALTDLTKAAELDKDPDVRFQRGMVYTSLKSYTRALNDFRVALEGGMPEGSLAALHNYIGMCEGQLGNLNASIAAHAKALKLNPTFKEAALNYAQMYKEIGFAKAANTAFVHAIEMAKGNEPWLHGAYTYR